MTAYHVFDVKIVFFLSFDSFVLLCVIVTWQRRLHMQPVLSAWTLFLLLIVDILALAGPVTEELHLCVHACAYACRLAGKVNLGFQMKGEADVSMYVGHHYYGDLVSLDIVYCRSMYLGMYNVKCTDTRDDISVECNHFNIYV